MTKSLTTFGLSLYRSTRIIIQEVVDEVGKNLGLVQRLCTLYFYRGFDQAASICEVRSKAANKEQKQVNMEVLQCMLGCLNSNPDFLNTLITDGES